MAEVARPAVVAGELDGHDFIAEQASEPEDGAHEALGLAGAPVHVLGPVDARRSLWELGGDHFSSRRPRLSVVAARYSPLGVVMRLELGDGDAGFPREGFGGGRGDAVLEGDLRRRGR